MITAVDRLLHDIRSRRASRAGVVLRVLKRLHVYHINAVPANVLCIKPAKDSGHIRFQYATELGPAETFPATFNNLMAYLCSIYHDFRIDRHLVPWVLAARNVTDWITANIGENLISQNRTQTRAGPPLMLGGLPLYVIEPAERPPAAPFSVARIHVSSPPSEAPSAAASPRARPRS